MKLRSILQFACFIIAAVFAAEGRDGNARLEFEVIKFCWSNRDKPAFVAEKHNFHMNNFPPNNGRLHDVISKWNSNRIPLKPWQVSLPEPYLINENESNHNVHKIYYNEEAFLSHLNQNGPISLFQDPYTGLSAAHLATLHDHSHGLHLLQEKYPRLLTVPILKTLTTPLHFAVLNNSYKCIELLLKACVNAFAVDKSGNSPLDLVLARQDYRALELFIKFGRILVHPALRQAAGYFMHAGNLKCAAKSIFFGAAFNIYDLQTHSSLLHLAVKMKDYQSFKVLKNFLPIKDVVFYAAARQDTKALELMDLASFSRNQSGGCLMKFAISRKLSGTFDFLINNVPRYKNLKGFSREAISFALLAAKEGFTPALKFFFAKGLFTHFMVDNSDLLGHALIAGQFECADWMVNEAGGDFLSAIYNNVSIHYQAVFTRNFKLLEFLLQRSLNPDFRMMLGEPVLHFAIVMNDFEMALWFLHHGASPFLPDTFGNNALLLASLQPNAEFKNNFFQILKQRIPIITIP